MSIAKTILCPFHEEKTPSLALWKNGTFHCFGCRAKGTWEEKDDAPVLTRENAPE